MSVKLISTSTRRWLMITLFFAQSIFAAAYLLFFTFLPITAVTLVDSQRFAGVPATIAILGRALAAYPTGWLMDRAGRRLGLSLGYLVTVAGAALCVGAISVDSFLLLCLAAALIGAGRSASEQARFAAAEIEAPHRRARAIGWVVFAGAIGALASPLLTGPAGDLARQFGLSHMAGPYLMAALLSLFSAVWLFVLLRPDPKQVESALAAAATTTPKTTAPSQATRPLHHIFASPSVQLATCALAISQLVMTLLMAITPLHMHDHHHPHTSISLVLTVHSLGMFGLSSLTGWLVERTSRHRVIAAGGLILALSTVLAPFSPHLVPLALSLFLLGLGWNFCFIAGSSLLTGSHEAGREPRESGWRHLAPDERGRVQGATEMIATLFAAAGSLGSGPAFVYGGITAVSGLGLALSVLLIGLAIGAMRRQSGPLVRVQRPA